ncbi:MAG: flagellar export protein FliJ [Candidatus Sedimenticola sp. (ex Thyasira tokunagai)]
MVSSKRFKPVQRVAESREQRAAREFGDSQRLMQAEEERLLELRRYHQEYLDRFEDTARRGISAGQMQEYRAFIAKLDLAINQQMQVVEASHQEFVIRKESWKKRHVRTKVLEKAVDRIRQSERKTIDLREQKEQDEHSLHSGKEKS